VGIFTLWSHAMPNASIIRVPATTVLTTVELPYVSTTVTTEAHTIRVNAPGLPEVARHEAGHAVANLRLGIDQERVTIVPNGGVGGSCVSAGSEAVWDERTARDMVLAYCAGYAALIAAGYSDADARVGCDDDFDHADELISTWQLPGDTQAWLVSAVELMRRPENVAAVTLVAEHLLRYKTLDVGYFEVLVDLADGNATEAQFAQYLQLRDLVEPGQPAG
jgi:hypothetical protein